MNKTVNINLGGLFFHIDEDAYQKLTRYFDAVRRSLSNSTGHEEIMKDIEMRIAELITERHSSDKQVINSGEVDEIIAIMGQPEDYRIEEEPQPQPSSQGNVRRSKKLYRDTDTGMLGGVCRGLSHYFGIDVVWFRVIFLILFFGFGTGLLAYIILWLAIPAAVTTAEKLEMRGEPVNISNIERTVRQEFENVTNRFSQADYNKMGNYAKTGAGRFAAALGQILESIFKIIGKIIGVLLLLFVMVMMVVLLISVFSIGSASLIEAPWNNFAEAVNYNDTPLWLAGLLILLTFGLPLVALFFLGLKLLAPNSRSLRPAARYTLLAIWIISLASLIYLAIQQWSEVAHDAKAVTKENLALKPTDTLNITFRFNDFYDQSVDDVNEYRITLDENGKSVVYSNDVSLEILKTNEKMPYIQIVREANGRSQGDAKTRAEKISYGYRMDGNTLILDNYLLAKAEEKYRGQEVEIYLYLPEGTLFRTDESVQHFDDSDNEFFNLHFSGNYLYRVDNNKVMCLTCPPDENEYGDIPGAPADTSGVTVREQVIINVDENGVLVKEKKHTKTKEITTGETKIIIE